MTALAASLAEFARHWSELATAATVGSTTMAAHGVPVERCLEANAIANRALELAAKLEELARNAAPMPPRTPRKDEP